MGDKSSALILLVLLHWLVPNHLVAAQPIDQSRVIFSDTPATKWEDAMVAGNGMIGVLEYGTAHAQRYVLNSHKIPRP